MIWLLLAKLAGSLTMWGFVITMGGVAYYWGIRARSPRLFALYAFNTLAGATLAAAGMHAIWEKAS